jgi:cyclophilin family peptidyl-prolyl cis-trans isomerase
MSRSRLVAAFLLCALAFPAGCRRESAAPPAESAAPDALDAPDAATELTTGNGRSRDVARIRVKDFGEIRVELRADEAPKTVENFVKLASEGFYAGTTFHRTIPEFMIQGGDPLSKDRDPRNDGQGGPGYRIPDERNRLPHLRGVVSMANNGNPNTGGSQFFICVVDRPDLDGRYTAFGRVIEGMDVVDRIVRVPRDEVGRYGPIDRPRENVVIEAVEIVRAGAEPSAASIGAAEPDPAGLPAPATDAPPGAEAAPSDAPASPEDASERPPFRE